MLFAPLIFFVSFAVIPYSISTSNHNAEFESGEKYYDHSLTQIEKGDLLNRAEVSSTVAESKSPISDVKDKRLLSILQTNSSKIVDENGEPKVVYHQTNATENVGTFDAENDDIRFSIASMSPEQIEQGVESANRKQNNRDALCRVKKNNITLSNYGEGFEQNNDEQRQADGSRVVESATPKMGDGIDRGDIRVLEEGLDATYGKYLPDSERTRRNKESERLVATAKSKCTTPLANADPN